MNMSIRSIRKEQTRLVWMDTYNMLHSIRYDS
jgi:hypothetical protein